MNLVTILWSMAAAAALTLCVVHALVWASDRSARESLALSVVALALACMAPIEWQMMFATSPAEYGASVRWLHIPIFFAITGIVLFVWLHFGTGKAWLAWTVIGLRCLILLVNFVAEPTFTFRSIDSLARVPFLGQQVATIGQAAVGPLQWLAVTSLFLLLLFIGDAAVKLWRIGGREAKRKAAVIGGAILLFLLVALGNTQPALWGFARMPVLITPAFFIMLLAMAYELSRHLLHAGRLARDLRESEQHLDLAASAAGLGIWVWDTAARKVQMTQKARALYGFQADETIYLDKWLGVIHPADVAAVRLDIEQALASGEEVAAEYRIQLPDGTVRWIAARGRAQPTPDGKPPVIRGVIRDITERKRDQDETAELRRELAHTGRVTLLGQLSSALAHELNQPLGAILRNAEAAGMLLQAPTPDLDELRAIVEDIRKDDRRAGEVLDRLRALLKRRSVEMQPLAVETLVQDVVALARADAAARRVRLEPDVAPRLPLALGDRVHLSQVLLNLIVNAMDAIGESHRGSGRIHIEARHADGMIEVAVTDSGPGIAPEHTGRVFEPFFTTKMHGMGMGLPVSRTIVEAHGGKLWAEDGARPGATFRFTLPIVAGAP